MTVRLLHSADLHLDAPLRAMAMADPELRDLVENASRAALDRLVAQCREGGARVLLLAGDVFDGAVQSIQTAAFFVGRMRMLEAVGVAVYVIRGNHDHENRTGWKVALPPNVHEFSAAGGSHLAPGLGEGVSLRVHGVSYGERSAPGSLLPLYAPPDPEAVNIGLLHTSLGGAAGHDAYAPCSVAELVAHGYDYWALGHVHTRAVHAEGPSWVVTPGSPQGRHINETGAKSATEIVLRDGAVQAIRAIPTASVLFEHVDVAVDADAAEDIETACRRAVERRAKEALGAAEALVARIRLVGSPEALRPLRFHAALRRRTVGDAVRALGACWLEDLVFAPTAAPASADPALSATDAPVLEIAAAMRQAADRPAMRHALGRILRDHLDLLPPHLLTGLAPDEAAFDRLLDALTEDVIEEVVAALGAGAEAGR
jgi:DNA repair exonuclease SbcCD nuclease subunit